VLCSPKTLLAAALALPLLLSAALRADDWPQWRGPNRDGVCGETGLLQSFPTGGLKVRWRAPVAWGFSQSRGCPWPGLPCRFRVDESINSLTVIGYGDGPSTAARVLSIL
jgi:hypothetical protein